MTAISSGVNESRSTNRRTRAEMRELREAIYNITKEIQPATVRQVYYQLVSQGLIEKTESAYRNIVIRLLTAMRRERIIPFKWISDNTRWMRKPRTYSSLAHMLEESQEFYRRDLWHDQDVYVEIWLEKEALAGVIYDVTAEWDVPLMVTRGYPSLSYLHTAGEAIADQGKSTYIYYLGDYDPSGLDIARTVERGIREFAPEAEVEFNRIAVTEKQIEIWRLPTRPTKMTDTRSKYFRGESVEVDAMPPRLLRSLVKRSIEQHVNRWRFDQLRLTEAAEHETLNRIVCNLGVVQ